MRIHREGFTSIMVMAVFVVLVAAIVNVFQPEQSLRHLILYALLGGSLMLVIQFFRSPTREIMPDEGNVLCPADGAVVVVEETIEEEYFQKPMKLVSIFMSPLNVHVNRYPIGGKVNYQKYHEGKFLVAWHPKSSALNERTSIVLENSRGSELLMRQIAGAVARRIVCYSKEGMRVNQGDELGFIKFGSRVDMYLPLDAEVIVKIGDKVKGGKTVIARF